VQGQVRPGVPLSGNLRCSLFRHYRLPALSRHGNAPLAELGIRGFFIRNYIIINRLYRILAPRLRSAGTGPEQPYPWHEITIDPSGGWLYSHSQPSVEGRLRICGRVCPSAQFQHQTKSKCSLDALGAHLELPKRPCRHPGVRGANCNPLRYGIHFIKCNRHQDFEFGGA
jgi:hypothetical protein